MCVYIFIYCIFLVDQINQMYSAFLLMKWKMSSSVGEILGGLERVIFLPSRYNHHIHSHSVTHTHLHVSWEPYPTCSGISGQKSLADTLGQLLGETLKSSWPSRHRMDVLTVQNSNSNRWHARGLKHRARPWLFTLDRSEALRERRSGRNLCISFPHLWDKTLKSTHLGKMQNISWI